MEKHQPPPVKIHERLQTVGDVFGIDYPVYTLFSMVDEVRYFPEFFAHLGETEEHRTLGATLPLSVDPPHSREVYAEAASKKLTLYFNRLCASLASKRMTMLGRESFPDRKSFIYEFPREMKRMRPDLVQFLVDIFRPNPLQPGPRLRGFYFSGIRQAAREVSLHEIPGDASLAHMESEATYFFGSRRPVTGVTALTPPTSSASTVMRWSFLSELFGKVVLPDHASQPASGVDRRLDLYRNVVLGSATLLLLFLTLAWTLSWARNREMLGNAAATVSNLPDTATSPPSLESLTQLDSLRRQIVELEGYQSGHPPLGMRWGLYSGDRAIPSLRAVYFARFRGLFLDPILSSFLAGFSQLGPASTVAYSDVYNDLKTYRMIAACKCRPDKTLLDRTLPGRLPWASVASPEIARLASLQIAFYTSELIRSNPYDRQISEDANAVELAQSYLAAFKGPDRLLRGLLDQVNHDHGPLTLAQYSPNYRDVLSGPDRIEFAYSKEGRDLVLKKIHDRAFVAGGEPCVVGINAAAAGLANYMPRDNSTTEAVEDLYVKEYIQRWKQFLSGYSVLRYRDPQDAAGKLAILADGNRSPLLALLFMVASNTYVPAPAAETQTPSAAKQMADRAADRGLSRWFPRLQRGRNEAREIAQVMPASAPSPQRASIADIGRAFQPAWSTVDPKNSDRFSGPANASYIGALAELGDSLHGFAQKLDASPDAASFDQANQAQSKAEGIARQLAANFNRTSEGTDVEVKRLVEEPIQGVRAVLPENPGQLMSKSANGAAAKLCHDFDQLRRKYPFNPSAREEVSIDELNRYFAPLTGELAQFVQQQPFSAILQRQGKVWIQNPAASQPHLSQQFLSALSAETQFAEMLYPDAGAQPHVEYALALSATAAIPFDLETAGRSVHCSGLSATLPRSFSWPDPSGGDARLTLRTALTVQAVGHGVWGIFRLLNKAQEHHADVFVFNRLGFEGDSQLLQDAEGKPFTLRVNVESKAAAPLFDENYFSRLPCVGKAVQ
jgi:type VI secretion system protein ImpL